MIMKEIDRNELKELIRELIREVIICRRVLILMVQSENVQTYFLWYRPIMWKKYLNLRAYLRVIL